MSNEGGIPSKLARRAGGGGGPTRGIGAGYAQNQQLVGAQDPEAAARVAAMAPEEAQRKAEEAQAAHDEVRELREELLYAAQNEGYQLPVAGEPDLVLASAPPDTIKEWHEDWEQAQRDAIDEEMGQGSAQSMAAQFAIKPEDIQYRGLLDTHRREAIEERLEPLDFGDMIFKGYVEQEIPIREDFTITMRTIPGDHGLWMEEYIANQEPTSQQHAEHWFSLLQVAVSLQKVGDKKVGRVDTSRITEKEHFWKEMEGKLKEINRYPAIFQDDLIVQYAWFCGRVRKLVVGNVSRKVGNS